MARLIVIGGREVPRERKVIRDADGEVEVNVDYDTSDEWYVFKGTCRVNGDIFHIYEF